MKYITIIIGMQNEGVTYALHPRSTRLLKEIHPEQFTAAVPVVFLGYSQPKDFESLHQPLWEYVVLLLTGLPIKEVLKEEFTIEFLDPIKKECHPLQRKTLEQDSPSDTQQ